MAVIDNENWRELIDEYKNCPELWKIKSNVYKNKDLKYKSWMKLLKIYDKIESGASISTLKNKINNLRTCYRRELKKVIRSEKSGAGLEDIYKPSLWYFNLLEFLRDHEVQLEGTSSIDSSDEVQDKLLSKLDQSEPEPPTSQEDECVICINARATMQTSPCGHRVVCRRCFVKTIQSAVAQRLLPLRCVICRTRVSRLTTGSGTFRLQGSSSSYSMGSKSWSVPGSASSYSVNSRVAASASLYSMSSGSSCMSNVSNNSSMSGASNKSGMSSVSSSTTSSSPETNLHNLMHHHHKNHENCSAGCLGAIPRNPNSHRQVSHSKYHTTYRYPDMPNRLPPIKEFKSPSKLPTPSPVHTNPKFRFASYTQPPKSMESIPLITISEQKQKSLLLTKSNGTISNGSIMTTTTTKLGMNSKVAPMNSLKSPVNKTNAIGNKKLIVNNALRVQPSTSSNSNNNNNSNLNNNGNHKTGTSGTMNQATAGSLKHDEIKSEIEKKKKDEKMKLKAEKEARKEEKRIAKEEERLAKMLAKEEKKRGKKEAKEALIASERK